MSTPVTRAVGEPATTIEGVVERMATIDAALPHADGVAYFNRLYLKVTEAVLEDVQGMTFEDEAFLTELDVVFANLYFRAYADWEATGTCAKPWRPLFRMRERPGNAPIQFALAGMNAHINHDLPVAVVATCGTLGLEPVPDTPHHRDYNRANDILEATQGRIKEWFSVGAIARVDHACGKVDDALAIWSVFAARRMAWEHAEVMWELRDNPRLGEAYQRTLGRMVGLAGRMTLL
jgi:hypothetical protein